MLLHLMNNVWRRVLRRKRKDFNILGCTILVLLHWIVFIFFTGSTTPSICWEPIDVVYTWVNASNPYFIVSALKWSKGENYDTARFDDKNELKYSLRSLELYAPWVRHIYIVANQIPNWLDLNNEIVSIVPHEQLAPNIDILPTFSSNAIETFLHRIPKLSKRFLYLNDDTFLGTPLYPEDLYTESEGVQIYQTLKVPDCAENCPWMYVGDGACDQRCNTVECQFDGGDCSTTFTPPFKLTDKHMEKQSKNSTPFKVNRFPLRKQTRQHKNVAYLQELMRQQNFTTLTELRNIIEMFEKQISVPAPQTTVRISSESTKKSEYQKPRNMHTFALIFTNRLLNRHYGFTSRKLIGHVGYMLDRNIIDAMQEKFADDVLRTASHRFRAKDDLQFQFAYYYFLMSEKVSLSVEQVFDEFDTDSSGTWSDREVRTFLTRMFPVLDWSAINIFENVIRNCAHNVLPEYGDAPKDVGHSTLAYESFKDSDLPTITRDLVSHCSLLTEAIKANLATRSKYKYKINPVRNDHSHIMDLNSNISQVTYDLDKIRRYPRKFICINDELDRAKIKDNKHVKNLLEDFYISLFPRRSKFELPANTRNTFSTWQEYQRWRHQKIALLAIGYFVMVLLILFLFRLFFCIYEAMLIRRYIQRVFRI